MICLTSYFWLGSMCWPWGTWRIKCQFASRGGGCQRLTNQLTREVCWSTSGSQWRWKVLTDWRPVRNYYNWGDEALFATTAIGRGCSPAPTGCVTHNVSRNCWDLIRLKICFVLILEMLERYRWRDVSVILNHLANWRITYTEQQPWQLFASTKFRCSWWVHQSWLQGKSVSLGNYAEIRLLSRFIQIA